MGQNDWSPGVSVGGKGEPVPLREIGEVALGALHVVPWITEGQVTPVSAEERLAFVGVDPASVTLGRVVLGAQGSRWRITQAEEIAGLIRVVLVRVD